MRYFQIYFTNLKLWF